MILGIYMAPLDNNLVAEWATQSCPEKGKGWRDGAMVRALAFHRCGPYSIPGLGVACGLSLLSILVPAPGDFLRVLRLSFLQKPTLQIPIWSSCHVKMRLPLFTNTLVYKYKCLR